MTSISALAAEARALAAGKPGRVLLGLAGAPASGKSTLAAALAAAVPGAVVLPMDGFHLDDAVLNARGQRARKGAPHTFDAAGFAAMLARLRAGETVYAPLFDRDLELSRNAAIEIGPEARLVVVEGNYLLHDEGDWAAVRPLLDACWFLDLPEADLEARLEARWQAYGLDDAARAAKIEGNDLPNARLIAATKRRADRVIPAAGLNLDPG